MKELVLPQVGAFFCDPAYTIKVYFLTTKNVLLTLTLLKFSLLNAHGTS